MNKLVRGAIVAAIATLVALTAAVPAFGAPAQWETVEVTMHYEQGTPIVMVTGTLPEGTKLPATVELAVPKGGQFQWAGEILGGDPSADPSVEYTVKDSGGMDVYAFTLTKAPMGQVEVVLPSAMAFDGTTYRSALSWTSVTDVPNVNLFVRIPSGAQVTEPAEGAGMTEGPAGYSYYSRKAAAVKPGAKLDLVFAYTAPAASAAGGATSGTSAPASNNTFPIVLIVAFAAGALALVYIGVKGKMAGNSSVTEPDDAEKRPAAERKQASAATAEDDETGDDEQVAVTTGGNKAPLIIGLVVVGIVVAGFAAAGSGTAAQKVGGAVIKDFGNQSACSSTQAGITTDDPEEVFAALKDVPGLGKVTVDPAAGSANIEFCVSSTNEQAVLGALSAAGVLGQSAPAPGAPAAPAAPTTSTP